MSEGEDGTLGPINGKPLDVSVRNDDLRELSDGALASRLSHAATYYAADDYEHELFAEAARRIHRDVQEVTAAVKPLNAVARVSCIYHDGIGDTETREAFAETLDGRPLCEECVEEALDQ